MTEKNKFIDEVITGISNGDFTVRGRRNIFRRVDDKFQIGISFGNRTVSGSILVCDFYGLIIWDEIEKIFWAGQGKRYTRGMSFSWSEPIFPPSAMVVDLNSSSDISQKKEAIIQEVCNTTIPKMVNLCDEGILSRKIRDDYLVSGLNPFRYIVIEAYLNGWSRIQEIVQTVIERQPELLKKEIESFSDRLEEFLLRNKKL